MNIFDATWALLLLPIAGVGASYLAETRRGAAMAVAVFSWLTVLAGLIVLGAAVHALPQTHQSTLVFWTFPVTQTPFNAASTTLLSPNFQVGVGYSANAAAVVLVVAVALAVALGQTQMMSQLRSDPRLSGLMRMTGVLGFGAVLLIMAPGLFQTLLGFELCGLPSTQRSQGGSAKVPAATGASAKPTPAPTRGSTRIESRDRTLTPRAVPPGLELSIEPTPQ